MKSASRRFFILVVLVLLAVVFLRFYLVADLGYFMMDEERDAFLVRRMLVDRRPLLIGGSIPGGINVGPMFFYISAIPYALSGLNPIGPAWGAGIIGVIGVIGVFLVGRELFGKRAGLLAAVFSGFSLVNIIYQRPWWPLTLSQVVTLAVYLALFRIGRDLKKWLFVLVGALIIGAQSDPSTLSLIPLSIIWLWWHRRRIGLTKKHYLAAVGLFFLAHATWVVFEFRHDFLTTKAIMGLFGTVFKGQSLGGLSFLDGWRSVWRMTAAMLYRLFLITGPLDVTKQISPAAEFLDARMSGIWWPAGWGILLVIGSYVIGSFRGVSLPYDKETPHQKGRQLLSTHFLISLMGILAYTAMFPGYVHEWMWFFMFPGFFLIAADIVIFISRKVQPYRVAPFVAVAVIVWAVWQVSLFFRLGNVAGLRAKLRAVQAAQTEIAGRPYELRSEGEGALRYGGWRYLFTLYGDPPAKSYMDYVYQDWLYPKVTVKPKIVVKVINGVDGNPEFEIIN